MSARKLAVELAVLEKAQRQQLLAELPPHKRAELNRLIEELQPMLAAPSAFDLIMAEMKNKSTREANFRRDFLHDEARLSQLLRAETVAIKKQLADIFVRGQKSLITERVTGILIDYLEEQARHLPQLPAVAKRKKAGWPRFWK